MPKILLYAVIAVLGVVVLKSLLEPKVPQTVVVTPKSNEPQWWERLIGAGSDLYTKLWGSGSASTAPKPTADDPDAAMTPSWL